MNLILIFQEHLERNEATGKLDWKPGTPAHIKASGAGYKKWLILTGHNKLKKPVEKSAPNEQ